MRLVLLLLAAVLSLWPGLSRAEVTRIDDVEVEIVAPTPVEARERAFLEARRTGYRLAMEAAGLPIPPRLSDEQVNAAVVAIEVRSERQSADKYSARFSLFVDVPDPAGKPASAPPPPGNASPASASPTDQAPVPSAPVNAKRGAWIYVIPAERAEGRIDRIWRRDTAWTQSFRAVGPIAGQSPLTPSGDDDDRALIAPPRLAANDASGLAALSQRHGAPVAAAILDRAPPTRAGRSDGAIQGVEVLYWSRGTGAQSLRHVFTDKTEITTANAIAQALLEQIVSPAPPPPPVPPPTPELAKTEPGKPEPAKPEPVKPEPAKAEPSTPEPQKPPPVVEKPAEEHVAEEPAPTIVQPFAYDLAGIDDWRRLRAGLRSIPGLTVAPSTITTGRVIGQLRYVGAAETLAAQLTAKGLGQSRPQAAPSAPSAAPAPAPKPPAASETPTAFPTPAPDVETGGFAAHLVSTRSQGEAEAEWSRLAARYPELLAGRKPLYRSVDLGPDRGVWWRVGVDGFEIRRDADAWCAKLAAFNQYCRVAAN